MYDMYMDAGDEKTLRQMKNGTLTNGFGDAMSGVMQGIPQAALSAILGGIAGGAPGAAINGIGSLVNSGISGYGKGSQEASNKLQGLYDKLKRANEDYRTMKRPSGLRQAGLSTQYFNQLY
jgi:outer membrane lipoprotein SlyB